MISRTHRFRGRKRITEVHRRGVSSRGPFFGIKALASSRQAPRVAIVVSKKISKSAVERNRIRRKLYACFRHKVLSETGSFDIVVTVFSIDLINVPQEKIKQQLQKMLAQAGALK